MYRSRSIFLLFVRILLRHRLNHYIHSSLSLSPPTPPRLAGWLQPKLGKVSNVVKATLEETLRSAKAALENAAMEEEMEKEKIDVTLPG